MNKGSSHTHFPGERPGEQINLILRRHPFFLIVTYLYITLFGIVVLGGYLFLNQSSLLAEVVSQPFIHDVLQFGLTLFFIYLFLGIFLSWIYYYLDVYIITDERIVSIDQVSFFNRIVSETRIERVQDVEIIVVGFFETILNFGNLRVQTAGADQFTIVLRGIANPYRAKDIILEQLEKYDAKKTSTDNPLTP